MGRLRIGSSRALRQWANFQEHDEDIIPTGRSCL